MKYLRLMSTDVMETSGEWWRHWPAAIRRSRGEQPTGGDRRRDRAPVWLSAQISRFRRARVLACSVGRFAGNEFAEVNSDDLVAFDGWTCKATNVRPAHEP